MQSKVIVLVLKRFGYVAYLVHAHEQVRVKYFGGGTCG
jgi:NurA-like 5'-3' nuclease